MLPTSDITVRLHAENQAIADLVNRAVNASDQELAASVTRELAAALTAHIAALRAGVYRKTAGAGTAEAGHIARSERQFAAMETLLAQLLSADPLRADTLPDRAAPASRDGGHPREQHRVLRRLQVEFTEHRHEVERVLLPLLRARFNDEGRAVLALRHHTEYRLTVRHTPAATA